MSALAVLSNSPLFEEERTPDDLWSLSNIPTKSPAGDSLAAKNVIKNKLEPEVIKDE